MKKFILIASMLFAAHFLFANSITIDNQTNCEFSFSFRGLEDPSNPSTYFESPQIIISPGDSITYNSPNDVPGLSVASTATFYFIKGFCTEPPAAGANPNASVGDMGWGGPISVISAIYGYFPACKNYLPFTIFWQYIGNDIKVTIS